MRAWHFRNLRLGLFLAPTPGDAPFLALAATAGAWLVSGNLKHFPKTSRGEVHVISPTDYLAHLRAVGG